MSDSPQDKRRKTAKEGSLLSPEATGGINAGKGLDFQTRYAVCHLPEWLGHETFHQLFFEGTGDIDVRHLGDGKSTRIHIQVKDHEVDRGELNAAIAHFQVLDKAYPDLYQRFTLACPGLATGLRSIEAGLARLRGAQPFYDDASSALDASRDELVKRFTNAGLRDSAQFIESKVFIDVGHQSMCHDGRAVELFIARMLKSPTYAKHLREMVEPAFAQMMRAISASRGTVLERNALEQMLLTAIAKGETGDKGVLIAVQNWTKESFDPQPDYELDWSVHFDRATRSVPSAETWNNELLPSLSSLKKQIITERAERLVRFRGKCPLSTGLAVGHTFPTVGGWVFEVPQPPSPEKWKSDAQPTIPYELAVEVIEDDVDGDDVVLGLNIRGDGRGDVSRYVASTGKKPRAFIFLSPPSQGGQAMAGAEDAVAFATATREQLNVLLKQYGLRRTRLFFYGPLALAIFLGQKLTAVGEVQLFEYQDPGYSPSLTLRT